MKATVTRYYEGNMRGNTDFKRSNKSFRNKRISNLVSNTLYSSYWGSRAWKFCSYGASRSPTLSTLWHGLLLKDWNSSTNQTQSAVCHLYLYNAISQIPSSLTVFTLQLQSLHWWEYLSSSCCQDHLTIRGVKHLDKYIALARQHLFIEINFFSY